MTGKHRENRLIFIDTLIHIYIHVTFVVNLKRETDQYNAVPSILSLPLLIGDLINFRLVEFDRYLLHAINRCVYENEDVLAKRIEADGEVMLRNILVQLGEESVAWLYT